MPGARSYFLTTERLGFSGWAEDDLPLAMALWGDPKVTSLIGGPFSVEQVGDRLSREVASGNAFGVQYWPMFLLDTSSDGDGFVGCAGLRPYRVEDRIYEIGFHLRPGYWGLGLAQEAARAVIGYAFGTLGVKGLFAGHHPSNEASRKLLEKLGFKFTHRELYADGFGTSVVSFDAAVDKATGDRQLCPRAAAELAIVWVQPGLGQRSLSPSAGRFDVRSGVLVCRSIAKSYFSKPPFEIIGRPSTAW